MGKKKQKKQQKKLVKSILREIAKIKEGRPGLTGSVGAPGVSEEKFTKYLAKQLNITDEKFAESISEHSERILNELAHRNQVSLIYNQLRLQTETLEAIVKVLNRQNEANGDLRIKLLELERHVQEIPRIYNLELQVTPDNPEVEEFLRGPVLADESTLGTEEYEAKRAEAEVITTDKPANPFADYQATEGSVWDDE